MKKFLAILALSLVCIGSAMGFTACDISSIGSTQGQSNNFSQTNNEVKETPYKSFSAQKLSAEPVAPIGDCLKVISSYTDGEYNYYLLDAGYIKQLYLTTLLGVQYNGYQVNLKKSIGESKGLDYSFTETVSKAYSTSSTHNTGISLGFEQSGKIGLKGLAKAEISFKQGLSYSWSGTTSNTTSKSTTNTQKSVESRSETIECAFYFDNNSSAPYGFYRYALYSTCDMYFEVCSSLDNQSLISMNVVSCVRESSMTVCSQYSESGNFENDSESDLQISEDYFKYLPIPTNTAPVIETSTDTVPKFYNLQPNVTSVTVNQDTKDGYFKFDLSELKQIMETYNLKIIKFNISLYITEIDDGYQEVYLINQSTPNYGWKNSTHTFDESLKIYTKFDIETLPGKKGSGRFTDQKLVDIQLIELADNFFLYCGAHGERGDDKWTASDVQIKLSFANN